MLVKPETSRVGLSGVTASSDYLGAPEGDPVLLGALCEPRVQCLVWGHQRGKLGLLGLEANN